MISRLITSLFANVIAFLAAAYFLPGFTVSGDPVSFIILVGIFTLINFIIYPIIRLVLTPLVVITFGLFTIIIHAGILYIVDLYSDHITIDGLLTLLYATVIIAAINIVFGMGRKVFKR